MILFGLSLGLGVSFGLGVSLLVAIGSAFWLRLVYAEV